jgi:hypothetical protein
MRKLHSHKLVQKLGKVVIVTGHARQRTAERHIPLCDIELTLLAGRKAPGRDKSIRYQYGNVMVIAKHTSKKIVVITAYRDSTA